MRLINVRTIQFEEFHTGQTPKYAILSHRWESEEVTFQDMSQLKTFGKKGFAKIQSACWISRNKGLSYLWVDTCCIDKTSSSELTEAINSMYAWYQDAEICFAYLTDIEARKHDIKDSVWFTRGWTLQELIAPKHVSFYDRNWVHLGTKDGLAHYLSHNTGIPIDVLVGHSRPSSCSIAQRMSWASKRQTERTEDRAYSLLGIFDVNMALLYGEGERSFTRLEEEIIRHSDDQSIFAWDCGHNGFITGPGGLLATSPSQFVRCQSVIRSSHSLPNTGGFTLTNVGLSISLLTLPWAMETYLCILHCGIKENPQFKLGIFLERLSSSQDAEQFARVSFNGDTVLPIPLQTALQDSQRQVRAIHVRQHLIDTPLRRWHGFRLHDFVLPLYTVDELYQARFDFRDKLRPMIRYSAEEMRAARHYHPNGLSGLPPRPIFFGMSRPAMMPNTMTVRGTAATIYIPPSRNDKNGERICWLKFGFDENFRPICIFGRRKSLWGGNSPHLAVHEDSFHDAEESPGDHALLFRNDWIVQLAPCENDKDIAALWQRRDYCVLKGSRDRGLDARIPFLRLHISIRLEAVPLNYPPDGRPDSLLPGMNVWTININTWRDGSKNGGMKTTMGTGELLLRGLDDIFLAV